MDEILPLVGVLIGGFLGFGAEFIRHFLNRRERTENRRSEFQRETLLRLQQVMFDLGRLTAQIHLHDTSAERYGHDYGRTQMTDTVSEGIRLATVELGKLEVRVLDDELRQRIARFKSSIDDIHDARSEDEGINVINRSIELHQSANARLGELLRALY